MSPEHRPFILYTAPATLAVILVGLVSWNWSTEIERQARHLERAHTSYATFYLGDGERMPAAEAVALAEARSSEQDEALAAAEMRLVAPLPDEFTTDRFTNASGLQQRLLVGIRTQADRGDIPLPRNLPLEGGLNPDANARSFELAQLYLLQQSMRVLLNGAKRIDAIEMTGGYRDPASRYAVLLCAFRLQADFRSTYGIIQHLADSGGGIGLQSCALVPQAGRGDLVELSGVISLLTPMDERWDLPVVAGADASGDADDNGGRRRSSRRR